MYSLWNWLLYLLWFCLTAVLLEKRAVEACKLTRRHLPAQLIWGLVLFALPALVLAVINLSLTGRFVPFQFLTLPGSRAAGFLLFQLLVAVTEECFFRGWMQSALVKRLPRWAAVCVTAAAFSLQIGRAHV